MAKALSVLMSVSVLVAAFSPAVYTYASLV